jgi:hypothetical protein
MNIQTFEFSSGGAYHIQGWGEWSIQLDAGGALTITHNVLGKIKNYPPVALAPEQSQVVWNLVQAVKFENLAPSQRPGLPDEVQYTFQIQDSERIYRVAIWINDARKTQLLMALVDAIGELIKARAGEKVILR